MTNKMAMQPWTFASRTFSLTDQAKFARLSGDANPMHLDPVAARRTQAGAPVVHGVHALLWALESLAITGKFLPSTASILADFKKFIYVGDLVETRLIHQAEDSLDMELLSDGVSSAAIHIDFVSQGDHANVISAAPAIIYGPSPTPNDLTDIAGLSGHIRAPKDGSGEIEHVFPHVTKVLGKDRLLSIALTSTLVGMVCPGLHSIFSSLAIRLEAPGAVTDGLSFGVSNVDERFRMVEMNIAGSGIAGEIVAFVRMPPVLQPGFSDIAGKVEGAEFQNTTALIVGGSRGLGASAAKIIAAGGGRTIVTYASGRLEAEKLRDEICAARGSEVCRIMRYDAREDFGGRMDEIDWRVNQLYYFATPQIYRQSAELYSASRLSEFLHFYVDAFFSVATALLQASTDSVKIFYPSSVFVDQLPKGMTEYSMAKAAGELLCQHMNRYMKHVQIMAPRLPRMLTDQSATVIPAEMEDTLEVMLPLIRQMHEIPTGTRQVAGVK